MATRKMQFWWDTAHWSITCNQQDPDAALYQPGGTNLIMMNQLAQQDQWPGKNMVSLGQ